MWGCESLICISIAEEQSAPQSKWTNEALTGWLNSYSERAELLHWKLYVTVPKRFYIPDDKETEQSVYAEHIDQETTRWKQPQGREIYSEPPRWHSQGCPASELPRSANPSGQVQAFSFFSILGSPETGSFFFGDVPLEANITCKGRLPWMHLACSGSAGSAAAAAVLLVVCPGRRGNPSGLAVRSAIFWALYWEE